MTDKTTARNSGIGFVGLLQIVFIVLRLTGYIEWQWWIVLLPSIISGVFYVAVIVLALVLAVIIAVAENEN